MTNQIGHLRYFFILFLLALTCSAAMAESDPTQTFINQQRVRLRDSQLQKPIIIEPGAKITLAEDWAQEMFGTSKPNFRQLEQLMLNPAEVSDRKKIRLQEFKEGKARKIDYFFPVVVEGPNGIQRGQMALQAYVRQDVVSAPFETERINYLKALEKEGGVACGECRKELSKSDPKKIVNEAIAKIQEKSAPVATELWEDYKAFALDFRKRFPNIDARNDSEAKVEFIRSLVAKFGQAKAGQIVKILTSYREAGNRQDDLGQIADLASVQRVIDNRAKDGPYRKTFGIRNKALRDSLINPVIADDVLATSLADKQFTVWNDSDVNLKAILSFDPEKSPAGERRKMILAFETHDLLNKNEIEFKGPMAGLVLNYHKQGTVPYWAKPRQRIADPIISVKRAGVAMDVNLKVHNGARHVFYTGRL